jgi:plasmid maintenance system antidote protein VapI
VAIKSFKADRSEAAFLGTPIKGFPPTHWRRLCAFQRTVFTGIVNGERSISADTALRLSRYFGTTPDFWLNLRTHFDLQMTARKDSARIEREVPRRVASGLLQTARGS